MPGLHGGVAQEHGDDPATLLIGVGQSVAVGIHRLPGRRHSDEGGRRRIDQGCGRGNRIAGQVEDAAGLERVLQVVLRQRLQTDYRSVGRIHRGGEHAHRRGTTESGTGDAVVGGILGAVHARRHDLGELHQHLGVARGHRADHARTAVVGDAVGGGDAADQVGHGDIDGSVHGQGRGQHEDRLILGPGDDLRAVLGGRRVGLGLQGDRSAPGAEEGAAHGDRLADSADGRLEGQIRRQPDAEGGGGRHRTGGAGDPHRIVPRRCFLQQAGDEALGAAFEHFQLHFGVAGEEYFEVFVVQSAAADGDLGADGALGRRHAADAERDLAGFERTVERHRLADREAQAHQRVGGLDGQGARGRADAHRIAGGGPDRRAQDVEAIGRCGAHSVGDGLAAIAQGRDGRCGNRQTGQAHGQSQKHGDRAVTKARGGGQQRGNANARVH